MSKNRKFQKLSKMIRNVMKRIRIRLSRKNSNPKKFFIKDEVGRNLEKFYQVKKKSIFQIWSQIIRNVMKRINNRV